MHITLANKITLARIVGVAVFVLLLLYFKSSLEEEAVHRELMRYGALSLFVVIILSDALDGYIARRNNEETDLGRILDPFADKALFFVSYIMLSHTSFHGTLPVIPMWLVWLVISRDLFLCCGALLIHILMGSVTITPSWTGKVTTFLQACVICLVLAKVSGAVFLSATLVAGLCTLISGVRYLIQGYLQLRG